MQPTLPAKEEPRAASDARLPEPAAAGQSPPISAGAQSAARRPRFFRRANAYEDIRSLLAGVVRKGRCLDLPAGRGVNLDGIVGAGFRPIVADLFPKKTRSKGHPCLKVNFLQPLPFADAAFSALLVSEGIEHHSGQTEFLKDCARILEPGGVLLVTTPNILNLRARLAYLLNGQYSFRRNPLSEVTQLWQGKYLGHVHQVDYFKLRFMLLQAGFRLRDVTAAKYSLFAILLGLFFYLPVRFFTRRVFRKTLEGHDEACEEILRHSLSADLLLGKKLIVLAEKRAV